MEDDDIREIKPLIEHWGDLFYGPIKVAAEKLDAIALQIGVQFKLWASQRSRNC